MEFGQDILEWNALLEIIRDELPDLRSVLEIGVFHGGTLAEWRRLVGPTGVVVGVDIDTSQSQFHEACLVEGDSRDASTWERVNAVCSTYDLLFIDGYHSYETAKSDFEMYSPMVRPGGLVAFHDINDRAQFGVYRLWEELKAKLTYWEISRNPAMGIGVVRP